MVAYHLGNTLSKNGTVSRGVCEIEEGYLTRVTEVTKIDTDGGYETAKGRIVMPETTHVSMNLWGLTPEIFDILRVEYDKFLREANLLKDEFFIPMVISGAVDAKQATVRVYENTDKWYGITYREDLEEIKNAIGGYIENGLYEISIQNTDFFE